MVSTIRRHPSTHTMTTEEFLSETSSMTKVSNRTAMTSRDDRGKGSPDNHMSKGNTKVGRRNT